ncbi:Acyl-coenzyme A synthetase ACSM5, mitochondrial [Apodemus speciosus]|uniref:medium-chain acyl-CoA ligase n=1 Tax=Apodemus speciosus TaxID=105296 RepID=A0ABQ0F004_APOSI
MVMIPGVSQLTGKDLKYRLQAARAKSIVTSDALAPQVDAISADCPSLQTKLLVSDTSRPGWINFRELLRCKKTVSKREVTHLKSQREIREASSEHSCIRTKSGDSVSIYFTSGTTGAPKMVEHSQCSYGLGFVASGRYWNHLSRRSKTKVGRWMALTESDIFWNTTDTGWVPNNYHLLCPNPLPAPCTRGSDKFQCLKHCLTGGEALNPDVRDKWKSQTGLELHEGYGQSETVLICGNLRDSTIKSGSMGKASPPYDVQIIDEEGNVLPPGKEGNIAVRIKPTRPFCFFNCYLDNPEKTAASERGDFYITGDLAHMDEDGYFWFLGRNDDVINSSSYRIGPVEVESALAEHPAVLESAVVSSPDPIRGEVVKAFIVLSPAYASHDPEALTRELQEHVKTVTAPYKYPRKRWLLFRNCQRQFLERFKEVN